MDTQTVRGLALAADLALDHDRLALITPQLGEWLTAANELSRKLEADEHRTTTPITAFRHPAVEGRPK